MNGQLRTADLVVLLVYLAGVFALGCWFARKSGKTDEFMAAGRSMAGWTIGLSIFGTYVSSLSFLGNSGKAFGSNWNSWVFALSLPVAALIAVRWFIPLYRSGNEISAYYHLEQRFGPWARLYALACYLLTQLARIGTILYLVALALAPLTGWDIRAIILLTGLMVTIYTLVGGIEAVIWTDVAQSIVLIAGAALCAILILTGMPEGPGQLFQIAGQNDKFSLGSFRLDPASLTAPDPTFWMVVIYGLFINVQNFGIDQSFVQRYITARSDKDARFSVWMASLMFPVVSALLFFIGTGLFSLYEARPELLTEVKRQVATARLAQDGHPVTPAALAATAATLTATDVGDKVLPHFIVTQLPTGVAGLLIAAIFAAAMSSVDTSLNSAASLYLCDIHRRFLRPKASEAESMRVLHVATLVIGIAGTLTALAMIRVRSALDAWWNLQGIFAGGMLGLFLLGMISRRTRNAPALAAVIGGVFVITWMSLSKTSGWPEDWAAWSNPLHSFMTIICGTTAIVILGVVLGRFLPAPKTPTAEA